MAGYGDPFSSSMPVLEYLLRGIKYNQAKQCPENRRMKMPVTPQILLRMRAVLEKSAHSKDTLCFGRRVPHVFFDFYARGKSRHLPVHSVTPLPT